ncbi:MAG: ribonuclease PH [Planctomycetota bacterium]|nr:ribonuclease PH [Planctomycetota bacterium]
MRTDGRGEDELRPITFERHFNDRRPGSVLVSVGSTRVLCTACVEDGVPPWLSNSGKGWLTAEYSMLPGSTDRRKARESRIGKADSRSLEISRFIGRSFRTAVDLKALRDRTVWLDCDVLQAHGGTRTAAVTGAYVALHDALTASNIKPWPIKTSVAAVSVGIVGGRALLDLDYKEDASASVDLNVTMTGDAEFIEIQGTAESRPFDDLALQEMLRLARLGIASITTKQQMAFES